MKLEDENISNFTLSALVVALGFLFINFVLTANKFFPVHQDDYVFLGSSLADASLSIERPVTMNLAFLAGDLGGVAPFVVVSFLTAMYPVLTIITLALLLRVRFSLSALAVFSFVSFAHTASFENSKYLGAVGLWSLFFGTASLIAIMAAWQTSRRALMVIAVVLYGLSVFAKEDYILPPLILVLGLATPFFESRLPRWRLLALFSVMSAVALASAAYSFALHSRFSGLGSTATGGPYDVIIDAFSVLTTLRHLTVGLVPLESAGAAAGLILAWSLQPKWRPALILMLLITASLVAPYALIPHNLPAYRVFGWLPWLAGFIATGVMSVALRLNRYNVGMLAATAFAIVVAVGSMRYYGQERNILSEWYLTEEAKQEKMVNFVVSNRDRLESEKVVGITGLEYLSPWSNNDGKYLQRRLGLRNEWVVFVPGESLFYQFGTEKTDSLINVRPASDVCERAMTVVHFERDGTGSFATAAEECESLEPPLQPSLGTVH